MHSGKKNHYLADLVTTLMALYNVLLNITEARKSIVFSPFARHTFQSQTPALCDVIGGTYLLKVRGHIYSQVFALLYLCKWPCFCPLPQMWKGFFRERLQTQG